MLFERLLCVRVVLGILYVLFRVIFIRSLERGNISFILYMGEKEV